MYLNIASLVGITIRMHVGASCVMYFVLNAVKINPHLFAERSWQIKVEEIRVMMRDNPYKPTALLLSALDETACE